jgi:hypothetical protein
MLHENGIKTYYALAELSDKNFHKIIGRKIYFADIRNEARKLSNAVTEEE